MLAHCRRMHLRTLLPKSLKSLSPDSTLGTACSLLAKTRRRHLPVLEGSTLVGIVSEWDVLRAWSKSRNTDPAISQVMTRNVHTAGPNEDVELCALRLLDERVGCLAVVDHGAFLGLVELRAVLNVVMAAGNAGVRRSGQRPGNPIERVTRKPIARSTAARRRRRAHDGLTP
jgi:CBS domain-containing protein